MTYALQVGKPDPVEHGLLGRVGLLDLLGVDPVEQARRPGLRGQHGLVRALELGDVLGRERRLLQRLLGLGHLLAGRLHLGERGWRCPGPGPRGPARAGRADPGAARTRRPARGRARRGRTRPARGSGWHREGPRWVGCRCPRARPGRARPATGARPARRIAPRGPRDRLAPIRRPRPRRRWPHPRHRWPRPPQPGPAGPSTRPRRDRPGPGRPPHAGWPASLVTSAGAGAPRRARDRRPRGRPRGTARP